MFDKARRDTRKQEKSYKKAMLDFAKDENKTEGVNLFEQEKMNATLKEKDCT